MSSAIASLDYEDGVTTCVFHSGGSYTWNNIPKDVFDEWYDSSSWGTFFHENIKNQYT